jgi:hypothetical protein
MNLAVTLEIGGWAADENHGSIVRLETLALAYLQAIRKMSA